MTTTPWGDSDHLHERKLAPAPGIDRAEVEQNQRERLYGATVAVVANKGYASSTVANLTELAGVSRTTFYRYFADKEACFLATLDVIVTGVLAVTRSQLKTDADWAARAERGLGAFVDALVLQPDAARLCVIEAEAAGPKAVAIVDFAVDQFSEMMAAVFEELPDHRGMPADIIKAMVGGIRKLLHTRLRRGEERELLDLVPALIQLALSYRPPPARLPDRRPRTKLDRGVERYRGVDEPAERLEIAAMHVIARDTYADATMAAIASTAGASLRTLYGSFDNKADVFEAALLRSRLRLAAVTLPAYKRADSWPKAMAAAVRASLGYFESERDFARLITVEIHAAGAPALESRDGALETGQRLIEAAPGYADLANPIAAEAIMGAIYALLANRVRAPGTPSLKGLAPLANYMILAPFLGPDKAFKWATE